MAKGYTTVTVRNDVLESLKDLKLNYHGIDITGNSDKILALINLYKSNYKCLDK